MGLQALFFYLFAFVAVASAFMVISARNPVHSVLFLILTFINASGLLLLTGAEFLAMILLVVYVFNFIDRQIVNILAEPIARDLDLSDTQIGLMTGLAFALFYTVLGTEDELASTAAGLESAKGVIRLALCPAAARLGAPGLPAPWHAPGASRVAP